MLIGQTCAEYKLLKELRNYQATLIRTYSTESASFTSNCAEFKWTNFNASNYMAQLHTLYVHGDIFRTIFVAKRLHAR